MTEDYNFIIQIIQNASFPVILALVVFMAYIKSMPLIKIILNKQVENQEKTLTNQQKQTEVLDRMRSILEDIKYSQQRTDKRLDHIEVRLGIVKTDAYTDKPLDSR